MNTRVRENIFVAAFDFTIVPRVIQWNCIDCNVVLYREPYSRDIWMSTEESTLSFPHVFLKFFSCSWLIRVYFRERKEREKHYFDFFFHFSGMNTT